MKAVMLEQQNKNSKFSPAIMVEIVSLVNNSMQIHCMSGQGLEMNFFGQEASKSRENASKYH